MWGVPERGRDVGLAVEPVAVLGVTGQRGGHDLERVLAGEARMLRQIDLAHAARAEQTLNRVPGEHVAGIQRHARDRSRDGAGPVRE